MCYYFVGPFVNKMGDNELIFLWSCVSVLFMMIWGCSSDDLLSFFSEIKARVEYDFLGGRP